VRTAIQDSAHSVRWIRVAFATCSLVADGWPDDRNAASLLGADFRSWDDAGVDWGRYDRVVLRSVFTYQHHIDEFLGWCRAVGSERLRNSPDLVSFTADELSHVLRKRSVLRSDEVAPVAREGFPRTLSVAQAMLEQDLVGPGEAGPAQRALAERVLAEVIARFGRPLFLRVDLVRESTDAPILMEIEAIDAVLYLASSPGASERFAAAVRAS
jgi:hypothetical protein